MPVKARSHTVTITVTTNRKITAAQARYAAWNAIDGLELWGQDDPDSPEPWGTGKIKVGRTSRPATT